MSKLFDKSLSTVVSKNFVLVRSLDEINELESVYLASFDDLKGHVRDIRYLRKIKINERRAGYSCVPDESCRYILNQIIIAPNEAYEMGASIEDAIVLDNASFEGLFDMSTGKHVRVLFNDKKDLDNMDGFFVSQSMIDTCMVYKRERDADIWDHYLEKSDTLFIGTPFVDQGDSKLKYVVEHNKDILLPSQ